jgi:hypothetical protein
MIVYLIDAVIVAGLIASGVYGYKGDKRRWNGGFCSICRTPWKWFDNDSQGGRGYHCEHGHYTWISWLRVKTQQAGG